MVAVTCVFEGTEEEVEQQSKRLKMRIMIIVFRFSCIF